MKELKKVLAFILCFVMVLGFVPTHAFAAEAQGTATASANEDFIRVFHLDAGRKYFTVDQVKEIIDAISAVGYTHLELVVGNEGLRLLLDDMSIEANGTTYDSDAVKNGIQSGNVAYSHSGEWTETEMDEIISYAASKHIEIIPLVNTPGHMNTILDAMEALGISSPAYKSGSTTSNTTVSLSNTAAVAFTKALVAKYAAYFAEQGCAYFNLGADEYAADVHSSGSMGFGVMQSGGWYDDYVNYINDVAAIIKDEGMTPIAFNDGIYFNENDDTAFDQDIIVAYWIPSWGTYYVASPAYLVSKGHKILNTNDDWYYVLGRNSQNDGYGYYNAYNGVNNTPVTKVADGTTMSTDNLAGSMNCVWCDEPEASYEDNKSNVMYFIETLAANNPDYFVVYTEPDPTDPPETEPTDPVMPETVTKTDEDTGISASAPGLSELKIEKIEDEAIIPTIDGATEILAYDVAAFVNGETYTDEIEISIPVPAEWTRVRGGVLASDSGEEVLGIEGKLENGHFTFTVPHLSGVITYAVDYDKQINLEIGETSATITDNSGYYTTAKDLDESIATVALGGNSGSEATVEYTEVTVTNATLLNTNTDTKTATGYYYKNGDTCYPLYATRENKGTRYNYVWYYSTDNGVTFTQCGSETRVRSYNNPSITVYTKSGTEAVDPYTTIAFTGKSAGETYATIGSTTYKIVVSKKQVTAAITVGSSQTYTDSSASAPVVADSSVAEATLNNGTLTITGIKAGNTTVTTDTAVYTIAVVTEILDNVSPIKVEWWITNIKVDATDGTVAAGTITYEGGSDQVVNYSEIPAAAAYGESGVLIADYVPKTARWTWSEALYFWKGALQIGEAQQQTAASGDMTAAGTDCYYVRYYQTKWWVSVDRTTWVEVDSGKLVAYYLQKQDVTDEVDVYFKDWGFAPGGSDGVEENQVALTVAVVYPDGSLSGSEEEIYVNSTTIFNYWDDRDIGIVSPANNSIYKISKITVTNGTRSGTGIFPAEYTETDYITWEKVTNEAGSQWYDERIVWTADVEKRDANDTNIPMVNGAANQDNVIWPAKDTAVLVLIYLETIEYENNLLVQWVDDDAQGALIHEMQVSITTEDTETDFYAELIQNSPLPVKGTGGTFVLDDDAYVVNSSDANQTFNKDITIIHGVADQYRSGLYQYTHAELSADGKTMILHYNINSAALSPLYVVDFGLPMTFGIEDLVENPEILKNVEFANAGKTNYGTAVINKVGTTYENATITYTPDTALHNVDVLKVTVTYNNDTSNTFRMGFIPASNVLYEEGFMTAGSSWTGGTKANGGADYQSAQFAGVITNTSGVQTVYGYDPAYSDETGASGTVYTANISSTNKMTDNLSFTFTGNGFDLIGTAGPQTGTLSVRVDLVKDDGTLTYVKAFIVDTAFVDSTYGTIYQVPFVHFMANDDKNGNGTNDANESLKYQVTVRGAYIDYGAASAANTMSTFGMRGGNSDAINEIYDLMYSMGLTDEQIDDVEFINLEHLYSDVSSFTYGGASTFATNGTVINASEAYVTPTYVAIDGFRTYRLSTDFTGYANVEKNLIYTNVMSDGITGGMSAYIEGNASGSYTVTEYEGLGGPQNEIYLPAGAAIVLQLKDSTVEYAQISARAVAGVTELNGTAITSNTEMYYVVDVDAGLVAIANTGENLLAIANLKAACGITAISDDNKEAAVAMVARMFSVRPDPEEPTEPEIPEEPTEPVCGGTACEYTYVAAEAATCVAGGNVEYWYCAEHGNYYVMGENGLTQTDAQAIETEPDATNHTGATELRNESDTYTGDLHCADCGALLEQGEAIEPSCGGTACEYTYVAAKAATCVDGGNVEYWYCAEHGNYYVMGENGLTQVNATDVLTNPDPEAHFSGCPHEEIEVFTPDKLDAKVSTVRVFRNKIVTLTVITSSDVDYITVNGEKIQSSRLFGLLSWGRGKTFILTMTVPANQETTYEIVAYDRDGVASEAYTVSGNGRR